MTPPALPTDATALDAVAALLDHLPLALVVTDAAENIAYINSQYRQMLRIPEAVPLVGGPARTTLAYLLQTFVNAAAVGAAVEQAVQEQRDLLDLRVELRDGRWMARSAARLPDGGWLVTYRDVTAETHVRQELEKVARIPAQNPNPVYQLAADGSVLFLNPAAQRLREDIGPDAAAAARAQMAQTVREALAGSGMREVEIIVADRVFSAYLTPFPQEQYVNMYLLEITARRAAEAETRRQRAFYESILDHLPADVVVIGPDLRYRYLNPQAIRDPELRAWIIGHDDLEYFAYRGRPRAVAERRQQVLRQALADGRQVSWDEEVARRDDPDTMHLTRFVQPVYDAGGAPLMLIGYGLDITPIREAQRTLAEQRTFYETILDQLPADVAVFDGELRYRYLNPQAQPDPELRRWVIGRTWAEFVRHAHIEPDQAARRDQVLTDALETRQLIAWNEDIVEPDGTVRTIRRHLRPLAEGDAPPHLLIGYGVDITAIREAERTLTRSEKQYRDLMEYTQALICTHDLHGQILSVNPAMAALLGYAPAELVGRSFAELMPAADQAAVAAYLAQFAHGADATGAGVLRMQPRRAAPRYLLYHNIRVQEAGQSPYVIGYAQDITERIQAERTTKRAKEAAEAAARTRENFLANMSHEIRTPLNGVLGMAGLLAKTNVDGYQRELLDVLQHSGQHLLGVLNDVLDVAKLSSEKLELSQETFNLCDAMSTSLEALMVQAQNKGITVHGRRLRESCPYPWVVGDAQRLTQVMLNLLSNAVKFTPAGGTIWVSGDQLSETPDTLTVSFGVRDTGIGIAPEQQTLIFQPFAQAYASISREFGGTGLGLSISRSLVERMGGNLELTSAPGHGSTFTFTLTLPRGSHRAAVPEKPAGAAGSVAGVRVLLVEDNAVNRLLARLLLAQHGAVVVEATTGAEAVAQLQAQSFDVVLMDIQMPVMNGLQATAAIRALPDPVRAATPIVALTANAFRSDTDAYLAAGMNACLTKPFAEADLLATLRELAVRPDLALVPAPTAEVGTAPVESGAIPGTFPSTALRIGHGSPAFVAEVVAEFLETTPPLLTRLAAAPPAEAATVAAIAHQLLPAVRALDAAEAATILAELEDLPGTDAQWADARDYAVSEIEALLTTLRHWQGTA